jgi:DNA modification methylase
MFLKGQLHEEKYSLYNGDSCEVLPGLPDESIDISAYSPPFAELYNYSSSDRDLSNCNSYADFLEHYGFIVKEMFRLTKPGRITAIHCMDLKGEGHNTWRDFPGDIIRLHEKYGFKYHSRHTIWKEPLRVAIRTRALGLAHRQLVKDSTECKSAGADYIIVMRKPGENKVPVTHEYGLTTYAGENQPSSALVLKYAKWENQSTNKLSHYIWRRYASSVWMDIRNGRVMQYKPARENKEEKHVCPLQLDVIERLLCLYSNPGELMLTPFMGVGSEVYCAVESGRRGIGIELKTTYYNQAVRNVKSAGLLGPKEGEDLLSLCAGKKDCPVVENEDEDLDEFADEDEAMEGVEGDDAEDEVDNGLEDDDDNE